MIEEHDRVALLTDVTDMGLETGDVGTVVHVHRGGEAFEVEFWTLQGETVAVTTLLSSQLRPVDRREVTHARRLAGV